MEGKPTDPANPYAKPTTASIANPSTELDSGFDSEGQGNVGLHDTWLIVSIVMMAINMGLLAMLFASMGLSTGFQFLFGFEASPEEKETIVYGLAVFLVFVVRLIFFPAYTVVALVGFSSAIGSLSDRSGRDAIAKLPSIGLLAFHILCLVPPLIFAYRTIVFLATH